MKQLIFLFVLFLVIPLQTTAQANFKKGLIVTARGDTLRGYLNDRDWERNPGKISFRATSDAVSDQIFNPANSICFQIEGEDVYHSFTVSVSLDEVSLSRLHIGTDTSRINRTVFLKVLVDGCNVNLYSYKDEIKTRFYIWDKSKKQPEELLYKVFYYESPALSGGKKIVTRNNYAGQLYSLAAQMRTNTPELRKKIELSPYEKQELSEIVMLINGNNATNMCSVIASKEKAKIVFFASVYLRRSIIHSLEIQSPFSLDINNNVDADSDHKAFWFPALGVGFDLAPRTGSRFCLREELRFTFEKLSSADQYSESYNYYNEDFTLRFSQWNITLSSGLNYNLYHSAKLKGYIGAGFDLNYSKVNASEHYCHWHDLYNEGFYSGPLYMPNEFWLSVPLRTGIIINNRFDFRFTYQGKRHMLRNLKDPEKIRIMEFGIAYLFD